MYDFLAMSALLSVPEEGLSPHNAFLSEIDPEAREYVLDNVDPNYVTRDTLEAWADKFYEEHK